MEKKRKEKESLFYSFYRKQEAKTISASLEVTPGTWY
jgi:hypothetical protein